MDDGAILTPMAMNARDLVAGPRKTPPKLHAVTEIIIEIMMLGRLPKTENGLVDRPAQAHAHRAEN
jgi:hypothetical protein